MKLLEVYAAILRFAKHGVDDRGSIFLLSDEKKSPIMIDGKEMVLPTDATLSSVKGRTYFHPFREQVNRGIAETTEEYLNRLNVMLNHAIAEVFIGLIDIVSSPKVHSQIDPGRKDLLKAVESADEESAVKISKIALREIKKGREAGFIRIYIKKGGTKKQEDGRARKFSRLAVVYFPLWEQINSPEPGVTKVEAVLLKELYQFVFPEIVTEEFYNFGSSDTMAPTIDAILRGALPISNRINELVDLYKEFTSNLEGITPFETDWVDALDNIHSYDREVSRISLLPGSDGQVNTSSSSQSSDKREETRSDEPVRAAAVPERREEKREPVRESRIDESGRNSEGKVPLSFLCANVSKVRNANNVLEGSIVQEIEEQWKRERKEAEDYWNRNRRPHPDFGTPEDVDYLYRSKLRDREDERRDHRSGRPRGMTRDEEIGYSEWLRDRDEAEDYYREYRKPHPHLGHPSDYREFDPRDPNYSRQAIEDRYARRDNRRDYRDDRRDDRGGYRDYRDDRRDRGYYEEDRYGRRDDRRDYRDDRRDDRRDYGGHRGRDDGYSRRSDVPWFAQ